MLSQKGFIERFNVSRNSVSLASDGPFSRKLDFVRAGMAAELAVRFGRMHNLSKS